MLSTTKTNRNGTAISSIRLSLRSAGGCFGGMCKLPPLTNHLFDELFRVDRLRTGAVNDPNPVISPVALVETDQTGEAK